MAVLMQILLDALRRYSWKRKQHVSGSRREGSRPLSAVGGPGVLGPGISLTEPGVKLSQVVAGRSGIIH